MWLLVETDFGQCIWVLGLKVAIQFCLFDGKLVVTRRRGVVRNCFFLRGGIWLEGVALGFVRTPTSLFIRALEIWDSGMLPLFDHSAAQAALV